VPPAARMVLKCACDIILILAAIFDNKGKAVMRDDFVHASRAYSTKPARDGLSVRTRVHRDVDSLIPTWSWKLHQPLKVTAMRRELRRMVRENRFSLEPDMSGDASLAIAAAEPVNTMVDLQALQNWKEAEAAAELAGDSAVSGADLDEWHRPDSRQVRAELTGETASPPQYSEPVLVENKVLISDPGLRRAKDNFGGWGHLPERLVTHAHAHEHARPCSEPQAVEMAAEPVTRPVEMAASLPSSASIRRKPVARNSDT